MADWWSVGTKLPLNHLIYENNWKLSEQASQAPGTLTLQIQIHTVDSSPELTFALDRSLSYSLYRTALPDSKSVRWLSQFEQNCTLIGTLANTTSLHYCTGQP